VLLYTRLLNRSEYQYKFNNWEHFVWLLKTGCCLIEVTANTGLTVHVFWFGAILLAKGWSIFSSNISAIHHSPNLHNYNSNLLVSMVTFLVLPRKYAATWVGRMFSSSILLSAAVRFTSSSSRAHWRRQIKSRRFVHSTWCQQRKMQGQTIGAERCKVKPLELKKYVQLKLYFLYVLIMLWKMFVLCSQLFLQQEKVWGLTFFLNHIICM